MAKYDRTISRDIEININEILDETMSDDEQQELMVDYLKICQIIDK